MTTDYTTYLSRLKRRDYKNRRLDEQNLKHCKSVLREWFRSESWTHAVSFFFEDHRTVPRDEAQRTLGVFFAILDRKQHGARRWTKVCFQDRINGMLLLDVDAEGRTHAHGCISIPEFYRSDVLEITNKKWKKLVPFPRAAVKIQPIDHQDGWIEFCLRVTDPDSLGHLVHLRQFHSSKKNNNQDESD